ncbi:acyltransferase family protein [Methylomonas sp. MS20]|uniref:acyltransferase family protein n=1 Tax=Methylomonas sp. MS20 TaxID=3418769 RepID=UPI003D008645
MIVKPVRLEALTSMRFFASAAVVFLHSRPFFETTKNLYAEAPLHYGVTFFFVLSGFILTYVYRDLQPVARVDFWIARIARIWPAHIFALCLFLLLIPSEQWTWDGANVPAVTMSNLFLLQSIIPIPEYYFSYNGVSWSVSTEVFFYVAFPYLIINFSSTWLRKLLLSMSIVLIILSVSCLFDLPSFSPDKFLDVTSHGMIYISPLTRILEFIIGMAAASFVIECRWINIICKFNNKWVIYTLFEVLALLLALYMATYLSRVAGAFGGKLETPLVTWVMHSSGANFSPF